MRFWLMKLLAGNRTVAFNFTVIGGKIQSNEIGYFSNVKFEYKD